MLTANLNSFDNVVEPAIQKLPDGIEMVYHCYDDLNFPPITGLTPRLQYRIPKTCGWQMKPGYDYYVWLDGSLSLTQEDSLEWLIDQLGDNNIAFFKHPWRKNIREEVEHIEDHLARGQPYITARYKNGLHREFLNRLEVEKYPDNVLYGSTAFIYRNTPKVQSALEDWWALQSRYFTCDQIQLPYVLWKHGLSVSVLDERLFKSDHVGLVSEHK